MYEKLSLHLYGVTTGLHTTFPALKREYFGVAGALAALVWSGQVAADLHGLLGFFAPERLLCAMLPLELGLPALLLIAALLRRRKPQSEGLHE